MLHKARSSLGSAHFLQQVRNMDIDISFIEENSMAKIQRENFLITYWNSKAVHRFHSSCAKAEIDEINSMIRSHFDGRRPSRTDSTHALITGKNHICWQSSGTRGVPRCTERERRFFCTRRSCIECYQFIAGCKGSHKKLDGYFITGRYCCCQLWQFVQRRP